MYHFGKLFTLVATLLCLIAGPAFSQSTAAPAEPAGVTLPTPLTREAVRELVARMSDDQVRDLLLQRLDAVAQAQQAVAPRSRFAALSDTVQRVWGVLTRAVTGLPETARLQLLAVSNFVRKSQDGGLLHLFVGLAEAILVGLIVQFLVALLSRRWLAAEGPPDQRTLRSSLLYLSHRLVRDLLGLVAFYIAARVSLRLLLTPRDLGFAVLALTTLAWLPRIGAALTRFVLTPDRPELRLVNIADRDARYLHRSLTALFLLMCAVYFIVRFNLSNGIAAGESQIGFWLNSAVHVYIGLIGWTARDGLSQMMRGDDPDRTASDETMAHVYPYFAIAVSAFTWLVVQIISASDNRLLLITAPHYVTMFWLLAAPVLDGVIRALVRHLQPPMIGQGPIAEAAHKANKRSLIRIGRVVVAGLILVQIADAWSVDLFDLTGRGPDTLSAMLFRFLFTLAIGYVVFEAVSLWINRLLSREQTTVQATDPEGGGEGGAAGGSRLATVLPLLRMTAQAAIAVIFVLLALGTLGIDITPLLAGAGILGLAIGFGAQKLVTDVVSGVFFLIDDAFRIGEYVEIDGTAGTVEKISIRSLQLRHHRGPVHTIPYGEIPKLTNFSRDWVIMKLKFTVPFDTDPNRVKKIFKKIGAEMMEAPEFREGFLEPFKSQGVFEFSDVGMVIRGKFMAKPGEQFSIRKEILNRVQKEFAAEGIEFARPEVRIAMPDSDDHSPLGEQVVSEALALAQKHRKDPGSE